ncbi:E3 ubiquitin-protein ligase KEG [Impatiens glandulifera]|uniref:E3 ubiquitin-protein ligase KEG n=1 Tax=Impatiens glandulifera TaxID=253017 RepID=UPI001FB1238F|nr:E3 ubiquitin-protein ligase KEG [Impatiens glandulifera]
MKVPSCSVCQTRYNEDERSPLLLQCGHGFCKDCLSKMFSASPDTTLSCPRCRHVSIVGNSVQALRKNYAILALIHSLLKTSHVLDCDLTDDEEDGERDDDVIGQSSRQSNGSSSGCDGGGSVIDLSTHSDLKLIKKIGEGTRPGVEMWSGVLSGRSGLCRHQMAVKKVAIGEDADMVWMQTQLETLRRASMWCRNVCTFHGIMSRESGLSLIMDKCYGSVLTEMKRNEGRLTLEQILRYGADIARGVTELHAAGIVCMNLKPSNLLLDANGQAVVSDYGLPAIFKKPNCGKAQLENDSSRIHSCMECTMLSANYTAPEAWEQEKKSLKLFWDDAIGISTESDSWSFGCTLVEMCTGSMPWMGLNEEEIYKFVVKAKRQPPQYTSVVGVGIPREIWKMIGECLQFKPSKRPTFNAMLAIFLRHLQEIPRSPPASPDNEVAKLTTTLRQLSPLSHTVVSRQDPNHLHQLVSEGNINGVREFLEKGAAEDGGVSFRLLLEAQNADGQTALHLACRRGSAELVETILEYDEANVDIVDKDGDPPLVFALASGSPECVRALIRRRANVRSMLRDGFGPSVAHVCAYHGQPDCMRELLLAGADPNAVDDEGGSVLHRAVSKKYTECALVILECGGCRSMSILNSKQLTPLHLCVATWNIDVVRRWIELASKDEIAEAVDIPSPMGSALCLAASLKKDHEAEGRELVQLLLSAGADPYAQDPQNGRTALHAAVMAGDALLVKIILDAGVDVNIRNVNNRIPLHMALARGSSSCIGLLLSAGADCNLQDDEGNNAFHIAAESAQMIRENLGWIIVMLNYPDAAVESRNHSGKTLHDFLEALPREWISEDLMEALVNKSFYLSPTIYQVGDWVKFKRSVITPTYGWQAANNNSIGFVQNVPEKDELLVSFCTGEARVLAKEIIKVIPLDRGQHVKLKTDVNEPRFGLRGQSRDSIGTVLCVDDDGILRVGFPGASRGWKADPAEMERVEEFKIGDWVRIRPTLTTAKHGLGSVTPGSIGIVYCIRPDSSLLLDLSYLPNPWHCEPEEVEPVVPFKIGERVCVRRSVAEPRYAWGGETHHSVGKISEIESDGLLILDIPNRPIPWQADPSDMEKVDDFKVGDWVRVKASVTSPKYGWEDITRSSIGIIHSLEDDGDMGVAFCFRSKLFCCSVTDVEKVPPFEAGQEIHVLSSITQPRLGWSNESHATVGKISRIDMDGALNAKVIGRTNLWKVSPGDVERLSGFEVGDWVRSKPFIGNRPSYDWNNFGKEGIAVVHSVQDTGYVELACCFRKGKWITHYTDIEKVPSLKIGQHVRFRTGMVEPRWGWRGARNDSRGIITSINADAETRVAFLGLPGLWRGDPADFELDQTFDVGDWVRMINDVGSWRSVVLGRIGVVQGNIYEGDVCDGRDVRVGFCGEQECWIGPSLYLEKVDKLALGQKIRVRVSIKQPRFGWSSQTHDSLGTICAIDADGKLRIHTPASTKPWMLDPSEVERVEEIEIKIGDWVKVSSKVPTLTHQWGDVTHSSIGVVHRIENGDLWVAFCFLERLWLCKSFEMERIRPFRVGDKAKIRDGLVMPRWGWGMETHSSKGVVVGVDANGRLRIKFQWREGKPWIGDPADIAIDES